MTRSPLLVLAVVGLLTVSMGWDCASAAAPANVNYNGGNSVEMPSRLLKKTRKRRKRRPSEVMMPNGVIRTREGEYIYPVTPSPQHFGADLRVVPYNFSNLEGSTPGVTYQNVYGQTAPTFVGLDGEWQFFKSAGKLGIQAGFGFITASGNGRFQDYPGFTPALETIQLFIFPIQASLVYRAMFWERQLIVPYALAGIDYFGILEYRDWKQDLSDKLLLGGSPTMHWALGGQIMLDGIDREGMREMDSEYGINHVYLTLGYRQNIQLGGLFDFTSGAFEGGVLIEF